MENLLQSYVSAMVLYVYCVNYTFETRHSITVLRVLDIMSRKYETITQDI